MMNWLEQHPVLVALVWPALSALLTALFKARTPEQYDKLPPRLAAFLKLVGALGLDVPNTLEAIGQTVTGRKETAGVYRAKRSDYTAPSPPTQPAPPPDETDTVP